MPNLSDLLAGREKAITEYYKIRIYTPRRDRPAVVARPARGVGGPTSRRKPSVTLFFTHVHSCVPVGTREAKRRCLRATLARGRRHRGRQPPLPHLSGELGHSGGRCGGARACQVLGASRPPVQRVQIVRVCTQCVYSAHAVHMHVHIPCSRGRIGRRSPLPRRRRGWRESHLPRACRTAPPCSAP